MINSLIQDSHISQTLCHSQKNHDTHRNTIRCAQVESSKVRNERRDYFCATVNNQGITATKPAKITFSGLSNVKLANEACIETIVKKARTCLSENANHKKVMNFISDSVEHVMGIKTSTDSNTINFAQTNKQNIQSIIEESKAFVIEDNKKEPLKNEKLLIETKNLVKSAVELYPAVENPDKARYSNKFFKNFLKMAADKQAVFSALFAIALTCIMRPAAIMALPGDKKHKDDKKYAAAHSIASGVIGYLFSLAIFSPISDAMKKIEKEPEKYIEKNAKLKYLESGKSLRIAKTFIGMAPEIILAAPRAVMTIAIIPPILKYVFGWEKKKPDSKEELSPILQNYALLNFKSTSTPQKKVFQSFSGGAN